MIARAWRGRLSDGRAGAILTDVASRLPLPDGIRAGVLAEPSRLTSLMPRRTSSPRPGPGAGGSRGGCKAPARRQAWPASWHGRIGPVGSSSRQPVPARAALARWGVGNAPGLALRGGRHHRGHGDRVGREPHAGPSAGRRVRLQLEHGADRAGAPRRRTLLGCGSGAGGRAQRLAPGEGGPPLGDGQRARSPGAGSRSCWCSSR